MDEDKKYKSFQDLEVWKKARVFKITVFELTVRFPADEKFALTDQLRKASRSSAASIAEGYGRFSYKDQLHFCIQARGSLFECLNHIIDAFDCNYITEKVKNEFAIKIEEVSRILNGYIAWLKTMNATK
ncbi:MAG: four helix bundle protein [Chitinophagaceae bacterium]|nr:four helix bundle protein [Chitinophagaceae bacterium]